MRPDKKITVSLPIGNIGVDHEKMEAVRRTFKPEKIEFELKGIWPAPCSESWVEISLDIAKFLAVAGAGHYAGKLYAMLDAGTKEGITKFNAILKRGDRESACDVPRDDRTEAIKILTEAIEKLQTESEKLQIESEKLPNTENTEGVTE